MESIALLEKATMTKEVNYHDTFKYNSTFSCEEYERDIWGYDGYDELANPEVLEKPSPPTKPEKEENLMAKFLAYLGVETKYTIYPKSDIDMRRMPQSPDPSGIPGNHSSPMR